MSLVFFDLEADNLLRDASVIWCGVAFDITNNMWHIYHTPIGNTLEYPGNSITHSNIGSFINVLNTASGLCHYNGIGFDLPLLKKLHGFSYTLDKQTDCHVLSRLYYPDRGGHSLQWWGEYLKCHKGVFADWSCFSAEMLSYCIQDVEILMRVHTALQKEAEGWDWSESIKLEKKIADIQMRQEMKGVLFDSKAAHILDLQIANELDELERVIMEGIPCKAVQVGVTITKPFLKSGGLSKQSLDFINNGERHGKNIN